MTRLAFLFALALLAGCDVQSNNGADENVTINADGNGQIAFNLPFAKGDIKIPASMMHNGNFDIDGVTMPAGAVMTGFHVDTDNGVSNVNVNFTAPQSPAEVRSYFVDQFRKKDVEATTAGDSVTGKSKDGAPFTIRVMPAGAGSKGSVLIQSKDRP